MFRVIHQTCTLLFNNAIIQNLAFRIFEHNTYVLKFGIKDFIF